MCLNAVHFGETPYLSERNSLSLTSCTFPYNYCTEYIIIRIVCSGLSTKVQPGFLSDDRLTNAAQSNVRSYVTVSRPNGNMLPKVDPTKAQTGGSLGQHC